MSEDVWDSAWKVKLRDGKLRTPFRHFTAIASGVVGELAEGYSCRPGTAFMGIKTWASSTEESADMLVEIGEQIGFRADGSVEVFETEPVQPPREEPYGYDITFTPFDGE